MLSNRLGQTAVFWVMTTCGFVRAYCLHLLSKSDLLVITPSSLVGDLISGTIQALLWRNSENREKHQPRGRSPG
jgi:hypothetical protein